MPRTAIESDDWEDDSDDWDATDEGEGALIDCPHCGREIYDAACCPFCNEYVTDEAAVARPKPWWLVFGVVVCLFVIYHWVF